MAVAVPAASPSRRPYRAAVPEGSSSLRCSAAVGGDLGIEEGDDVGEQRPAEHDQAEPEGLAHVGVAQADGRHRCAERHGDEAEGPAGGQQRRAEGHGEDPDDGGDRRLHQQRAQQDRECEEQTDVREADAVLPSRGKPDDGCGQDADGPGQPPAGIAGEDDERGRQGAQAAAQRVRPRPREGGPGCGRHGRWRTMPELYLAAVGVTSRARARPRARASWRGTARGALVGHSARAWRSPDSSSTILEDRGATTSPCGRHPLAMMDPWQVGRRCPTTPPPCTAGEAVCRRCGTSCSDRTPTGSCSCSSSSTTSSSRSAGTAASPWSSRPFGSG